MAASNKQPFGSRPGHAQVHTHAPHTGGTGNSGKGNSPDGKGTGVAGHGAPKPVGKGKSNPLR